MRLLEQARVDMRQHIESDEGFGTEITLTSPNSDVAVVTALASTHHIQINPETGQIMNAKNVHFTVSESTLVDVAYPLRNNDNAVDLKGHRVSFVDSAGITRTYIVDEWWPDETLGVIVTQLGDYTNG
jgi:hypothetical protein